MKTFLEQPTSTALPDNVKQIFISFETDGLKPKLTAVVMPIYLEKALNMPYINL